MTVYIPDISNDQWLSLAGLAPISATPVEPPVDPPVDPGDPPAGWEDVVASRDIEEVREWYSINTGHEALGLSVGDLTPVGSFTTSHNGQVVEGLNILGGLNYAHSNVVVRGCRIRRGSTYGVRYNPTSGATYLNNTLEYCTFDRDETEVTAADAKSVAMILPSDDIPSQTMLFQYNNCFGWGGGARLRSKSLAQYNWVHDAQYPGDAHLNMMRFVGVGGRAIRNYLDGGRSGTLSIYFDKESTHDIQFIENILDNSSALGQPSYFMNFKRGDFMAASTGIKVLNNYFGHGYQYGLMAGMGVYEDGRQISWGFNGNERSGNVDFYTGEAV